MYLLRCPQLSCRLAENRSCRGNICGWFPCPDGTVHLKAGELAATLTTGSDGTATTEPLYLGRYQVLERSAPNGMVIDPEPKEVVLSYAGQEVEITSASVGFYNERQKVEISLQKLLEQDETFSIGMNEEWKNITFGLFAAEELTAADGTSIPAGNHRH